MSKRGIKLALVAGLLLALLAGIAPVEAKKPPKPPPEDPDPAIAYAVIVKVKGNPYGKHGLMVMNASGSNQTEVPLPEGINAYFNTLSWSPDGNRLSFLAADSDGWGIHVLNIDGTGHETLVLLDAGVPGAPLGQTAWSPCDVTIEGEQHPCVAYADREDGYGQSDLFLVTVDTKERFRLTNTPDRGERGPSWSLDGTLLAHKVEDYDGESPKHPDLWAIYDLTDGSCVLRQHGGGLSGLTSDRPSWAKTVDNQDKILWNAIDNTSGKNEVWLMDLDDELNPVRITYTADVSETHLDWSADDSKIVFTRNTRRGKAIEVMDLDGSNRQILANEGFAPKWRR